MVRQFLSRVESAGPMVGVLLLAGLTLAALILALLLAPQGLGESAVIAVLSFGAAAMTVVAYVMARARERGEESVQTLKTKLNQVQRFADDLIDHDTLFQNDLIETNTRLNQRVLQLARLLDVGKRLVSTYSPDTVVQHIVDSVSDIVGYGWAMMEISDPRVGGHPPLKVYESGRSASDADHGQSFELSAPMEIRGVEIGSLRLITDRVNTGTPEDTHALSTLATYAAIALENARLYAALTAVNRDLSALKDYNEDIVECTASGVVVIDASLRVSTWNSSMERISGIQREHALGRHLFSLLEALSGDELHKQVAGALVDGNLREVRNVTLRAAGGSEFIGYIRISTLQSGAGNVSRVILSVEDVTDKVRMGEQLRRAERIRTVGEFAAGMAHEINNPIGIISACAEYLAAKIEAEVPDPERFVRRLRIIEEEASRCSAIVRNLLVFARHSEFKQTRVDLTSLVSDAMLLVSPRAHRERVEVALSMSDTPNVTGDEHQLKQVFLNLFLNALEASSPGSKIDVSTRFVAREEADPAVLSQFAASGSTEAEGYVEVCVADQGPGIREEDLNRIFNPFFTTKPDGTGLGLAISLSIVEGHGGQIHVDSRQGKGCAFRVRLPVGPSR
jgi:PAS domain S-box-containing protein